jgi:hypothetical protein
MRLTMNERKKATAVVSGRYQKARKKDKGLILDEFVKLTGYSRRYASHALISHGRKLRVNKRYILQLDVKKTASRRKAKVYDAEVSKALKEIWYIMDCICGKRLAPALKDVVRRFGGALPHALPQGRDGPMRRMLCLLSFGLSVPVYGIF